MMKYYKLSNLLLVMTLILTGCMQRQTGKKQTEEEQKKIEGVNDWKTVVEAKLMLYGHRNWIVVADGAYPSQSNPAIETMTISATQLEAVKFVNDLISNARHVDANILVDKEMAFVSENKARGIEAYRTNLLKILEGKSINTKLHEEIIAELDSAAELFNVLVLKTDLAIPYTSVFFQLDCGYWDSEAEKELRKTMGKAN